ncbi:hypothetical protein L7F22_047770 [Adiantum nelumboides]|nr:hypothetical protein [Adiantum nelumboides]
MPEGTVEVELIQAHDLKDVEAFGKSDPYCLLSCGHVKHRSRPIHDGGSSPIWNQSFLFEIPDGVPELSIQLLDLERHGRDEAMGIAIIPLAQVYAQRQIAPAKYKVQLPNGHFHGDIEVRLKFFPKVHHGALDLHLVKGHGLLSADVLDKSDPYAIITCHKQNLKSRVKQDGGSDPHWDQTFVFTIDSEVTEVMIKLFDQDTFTADDPLGTAIIPLHKAFAEGFVPPTEYKVLGRMGQPQGEVTVGLKFTPKL